MKKNYIITIIICCLFFTIIIYLYSDRLSKTKSASSIFQADFDEITRNIEYNITLKNELIDKLDEILTDTITKDKEDYANNVNNFEQIDISIVNLKIDTNENFLLYTGRSTCPWCQKLVPILSEFSLNENVPIYYLDSENTDTNLELKNFRKLYNIQTVPSIDYYKDKNHYKIEFDITSNDFNLEQLKECIYYYLE